MSKLLIVESPTKVRTLSTYLGKEFLVLPTFGHLMDLPKGRLGIDVEKDFALEYEYLPGKKKVISAILKAAKNSELTYLGTDPDREGEFIAALLAEKIGKSSVVKRVKFREISKSAILEALENPDKLDDALVESQKARRILDRLIGYKVSPFLWKWIRSGLSAGRVQSVALKWICEREQEIREFVQEVSWEVCADVRFSAEKEDMVRFHRSQGDFPTEREAREFLDSILEKKNQLAVLSRKENEAKTLPPPPFTTASMQQEAFRLLRFPAAKTLKLAQALYEGVDIGFGKRQGLITYMRTDSTRLSSKSISEIQEQILDRFGREFISNLGPRKTKARGKIQDAHEAIRPVDPRISPEQIYRLSDRSISKDAKSLYEIIWKRSIASQMIPETWKRIQFKAKTQDIDWEGEIKGTILPGYKILYGGTPRNFPLWKVGDLLSPENWDVISKTTEPPPRYTEASIVARLEKDGIGRPSTFATILETLYKRKYCEREKSSILATPLGEKVNSFLQNAFSDLFREKFTSEMESRLDAIAEGKESEKKLLQEFYVALEKTLKNTNVRQVITQVKSEKKKVGYGVCPICGKGEKVLKSSKKKKYFICSRFPEC
ncbi:DNA topoisomerase I, partial [Leptospira perolatii]